MDDIRIYEGEVTEVKEDTFWATCHNILDRTQPMEVVNIDVAKVEEVGIGDLEAGDVFYWVVQPDRSIIRFAKSPCWTQQQLDEVQARAKEMYEALKLEPEREEE